MSELTSITGVTLDCARYLFKPERLKFIDGFSFYNTDYNNLKIVTNVSDLYLKIQGDIIYSYFHENKNKDTDLLKEHREDYNDFTKIYSDYDLHINCTGRVQMLFITYSILLALKSICYYEQYRFLNVYYNDGCIEIKEDKFSIVLDNMQEYVNEKLKHINDSGEIEEQNRFKDLEKIINAKKSLSYLEGHIKYINEERIAAKLSTGMSLTKAEISKYPKLIAAAIIREKLIDTIRNGIRNYLNEYSNYSQIRRAIRWYKMKYNIE